MQPSQDPVRRNPTIAPDHAEPTPADLLGVQVLEPSDAPHHRARLASRNGISAKRMRAVLTIHHATPDAAREVRSVSTAPSRTKRRLVFARALVAPIVAVALVSHSAYADHSLVDLLLRMTGYSLLVGGLVGRIWTSAFISGMKGQVLITAGPYSVVRNPLYCFSAIGFIGAGLALGSVALATAFGAVFFLTHWLTILDEEEKLRAAFPGQYDDYAHAVPRFIPQPRKFTIPEELPFKPSVFSRAVADGLLASLILPAAQALQWAHVHAILPMWFRLP